MKVIYNKILPFKGFSAINIFGILFAREEYRPLSNKVLNHEAIHTAQMKELLYIPFYILYGCEYLYNLIKYMDSYRAYKAISFEKEAYKYERDFNYLNNRKKYAEFKL